MSLALSACTSFINVLFCRSILRTFGIYVSFKFYLFFQSFYSALYTFPECCESVFRIILVIESEKSGLTNRTMVKPRRIFSPKIAGKGSFHGFGIIEISDKRRDIVFLILIFFSADEVHVLVRAHQGHLKASFESFFIF
jgi:hypothetical protein